VRKNPLYCGHGSTRRWKTKVETTELGRLLLFFRGIWASITAPNQAISRPTIENYYNQASAVHSRYLQLSRSRIEFRTLAVYPAYQRQGFGEKLVEWCGIRACEEDVPVFGDASTKGLPLYLRNGCEDIGRIILPKQIVNPGDGLESIELDGMEVVVLR
jgi:GNAT superfamily N-acetyltransferase